MKSKLSLILIIAAMATLLFACAPVPPPEGPDVPPHVKLVTPPDGVSFAREAIIQVTLDLQAGRGVSPDPEVSGVSLYLNGERITDVLWVLEGQPPATGFIKANTQPGRGYIFDPGEHVLEVRYRDLEEEQFSFSWRVTSRDVPPRTEQDNS